MASHLTQPGSQTLSRLAIAVLLIGSVPVLAPPARAQCETQSLTASDGNREDHFGLDVALDGPIAAVGAPGNGPGAVYVFRQVGTDWIEEQILRAGDGIGGDSFGSAVAVRGNRIAVGAEARDDVGYSSGAAYLFSFDGTSWVQQQKIVPADAAAGDRFGVDVDLTADHLLVGAPGQDEAAIGAGAAYVFAWNGSSWVLEAKLMASGSQAFDELGSAVALADGLAVATAPSAESFVGHATIFAWTGSSWAEQQTIHPTNPNGAAIEFGRSVDLDGDRLVVGAPFSVDGQAHPFHFDGQSWVEEAILTASTGEPGDDFGAAVTLDAGRVIVGAIAHDDPGLDSGAAYLYELDGTGWVERRELLAEEGKAGDWYGYAVALQGDVALVGSPWDDLPSANAGSTRVLRFDLVPAVWSNYGAGWPGTFGIPDIIALANPALGTTLDVQIENSRFTKSTSGFLLVGLSQISWDTPLGGTLLVSPQLLLAIDLPAFGQLVVSGTLPSDPALLGVHVFLQALENDSGASMGVSFTPGLELILGEC